MLLLEEEKEKKKLSTYLYHDYMVVVLRLPE